MASLFSSIFGHRKGKVRITEGIKAKIITSSSSHPVPSSQIFKYDVFLSFRGEDTRNNFTAFLFDELKGAGIDVYIDSTELHAGQEIHSSLMETIERSTISIPIFSRDYASSRSCLQEVAKMLECRKTKGQIVLPIFFDINPSDVRNQKGTFEASFHRHQKKGVEPQILDSWREALCEIGYLKGYTVSGVQSDLVHKIVSDVMELLKTGDIDVPEYLVGINRPVQEMLEAIQLFSGDMRIIGICGMPGIGKTTLAKVVYNKLYRHFQGYSFISNIRGRSGVEGLCSLQKQLISQLLKQNFERLNSFEDNIKFIRHRFCNMRVLLVLDDIQCLDQIKAFGVDLCCFGSGSRIMLTTRKPELLDEARVAHKYKVETLDEVCAFQLFCWHAFGTEFPRGEFYELSTEIASSTGGIPIVIEVVSSYLSYHKSRDRWQEALQQLRNSDHEKLENLLNTSYRNLSRQQQQIFLDIACSLTGESSTVAHYMWEHCAFYPLQGVDKLLNMSLLKIGENNELLMSNPVCEFGRKLVLEENREPGMRSRLWLDEALNVLKEKRGTEKIEVLDLKFDSGWSEFFTNEEFDSLSGLRFLRLDKAKIVGDFRNLLLNLRWLEWKNCTEILEKLSNLTLKKLVILNLSSSKVTQDWEGWSLVTENAEKLKVLVLANCNDLEGIPLFPDHIELERLNLAHCSRLRRINISSGTLKTLASLNIECCRNVNELPRGLCFMKALKELIVDETSITEINAGILAMENLETLSARRCKNLRTINSSIGNLKSLSCLALDDTAIQELPDSIGYLMKLQNLSLKNCRKLRTLPDSVGKLSSLTRMDLSNTAIDELPITIAGLKSLKVLLMERTYVGKFPTAIGNLEKLEEIDFSLCPSMNGEIPRNINSMSSLTSLVLSSTAISSLPDSISGVSHLQVLDLRACNELKYLPRLPARLTILRVGSSKMRIIPDLSYMKNLTELHLADNDDPEATPSRLDEPWPANSFQWICNLSKLEILELHISKIKVLLVDFGGLNKLRKLVLSCPHLKRLPRLPSRLLALRIYCRSMSKYLSFHDLTCLFQLELEHCEHGVFLDIGNLMELRILRITGKYQTQLRGIQRLSCLKKLTLSHCIVIEGSVLSTLENRGVEIERYP